MAAPQIDDPTSLGADLLRTMRVKALYNPYYYIKNVIGNPDMVPHVHGVDLMNVLRRMRAGYRHQGIEYFRGGLKTTTFTKGMSTWLVLPKDPNDKDFALELAKRDPGLGINEQEWDWREKLRDPDYMQLIVFETLPNAQRKLSEIMALFDENQLFRGLFPEIIWEGSRPHKQAPSWNDECLIIPRVGRNRGKGEGTFEAKGVGNALQSTHFDIVWADDLVGERAMRSELEMEHTKGYYERLVGVEQPGGRTWHFMIANRWGFNDLNAKAREETDSEGKPFWHFYKRAIILLDENDQILYDDEGRWIPAWPEMYPLKTILDKKARMKEDEFYAQYLNLPKPPGESEVEAGHIHRYTVNARMECCCSCGAVHHPETMNRYMLLDPNNAKPATRSKSAPALAVVGLTHDKHVFLLEGWQKKVSQTKVADKIFEFNDRWDVLKFGYEDVGSQNMWAVYLKREQQSEEFRKSKHRPLRSIVAVPTNNKPLEVRFRDYFIPIVEGRDGCGMFSVREGFEIFGNMLRTYPYSVPGHDYDLLSALAMGPHPDFGWHFPYAQDEMQNFERDEEEYLAEFNENYSVVAG
jgi:hypothetical protein